MALSDDVESISAVVSATRATVVLIEDEALFAKAVIRRLSKSGFNCIHAATLAAAAECLVSREPDLVLLDMRLPDGSGLDFLQRLRETSDVPVIVMTAYGEVEDAVTAMKHAASDYLNKPLDLDELQINIEKVLAASAINRQLEYSKAREGNRPDVAGMLGESSQICLIREQVKKIAGLVNIDTVPPTVLLTGETGSGKDVAARMLHRCSGRRSRPFVHVDCAALPNDLIEAELFGHVKGAFTNAVNERTGLIEAAEDGIVFLDEIGEIPLELQAKLLAVLERRSLRRIGSSHERRTTAWFIAATNRSVDEMVASGTLRSDLYFRLKVLTIELPPLRLRNGDAVILARHFAKEVGRRYGMGEIELSDAAERRINQYSWPGNVRELNHVLERAVLLSGTGTLDDSALGLDGNTPSESDTPPIFDEMTLEEMEKLMIERALEASAENVSEAARRLGITRMAMRYRMQKYGLHSAGG
ncbi:MAG: sigma-54 dependent transcriptional regulator [Pseudomonadota bacterium]|nr:sigma-54 dependent transcriptional regulator [Pseudomonadota bacterium]